MAKLITIIILSTICLARAGKYESNYEAFTIGLGLKGRALLCLGECINGRCVYNWHGDETDCRTSNILTKKYTTKDIQVCISNCDKYNEKSYEWCVTANNNWDTCSRTIALKAKLRHTTKNKYVTCDNDCDKHGLAYYWCKTILSWEYCHIDDKALVPNYPTTAETTCETPCKLYDGNYKAYCYDTRGKWVRCFLNPRYEHVLHNITQQMRNFRFGVYNMYKDYRLCKNVHERAEIHDRAKEHERAVQNNLHLNECGLDIESIAHRHRANNPTEEVRAIDPSEPITLDANPILSYTILPRVGSFEQTITTGDVDIPLVLQARLTTYTLQPPGWREPCRFYITLNYFRMNPNPGQYREKRDESGYILNAQLGGPMEIYNIFPQTWSLYLGCGMSWFGPHLNTFLRGHTDRYVEFLAVLGYRTDARGKLVPRPVNIGVRLRFFENNNLTDGKGNRLDNFEDNETENMLFSNDPDACCCQGI